MNCDCIKDIEAKIAGFMVQKAGEDATAKVVNTALCVTADMGEMFLSLQIPFRVKGSKKGYTSERGKEVGCNVTYCPFCGRTAAPGRYVIGADAGIAAALEAAEARNRQLQEELECQ